MAVVLTHLCKLLSFFSFIAVKKQTDELLQLLYVIIIVISIRFDVKNLCFTHV